MNIDGGGCPAAGATGGWRRAGLANSSSSTRGAGTPGAAPSRISQAYGMLVTSRLRAAGVRPWSCDQQSRIGGVSNYNQIVGNYTNPILNPGSASRAGAWRTSLREVGYPTPSNQCWPAGVPYIFWNYGMQILQQPDKVTILFFTITKFRQCA